jgi:hypothetical protein
MSRVVTDAVENERWKTAKPVLLELVDCARNNCATHMGLYEPMYVKKNGRPMYKHKLLSKWLLYAQRSCDDDKRWHWWITESHPWAWEDAKEGRGGRGCMRVASEAATAEEITGDWEVNDKTDSGCADDLLQVRVRVGTQEVVREWEEAMPDPVLLAVADSASNNCEGWDGLYKPLFGQEVHGRPVYQARWGNPLRSRQLRFSTMSKGGQGQQEEEQQGWWVLSYDLEIEEDNMQREFGKSDIWLQRAMQFMAWVHGPDVTSDPARGGWMRYGRGRVCSDARNAEDIDGVWEAYREERWRMGGEWTTAKVTVRSPPKATVFGEWTTAKDKRAWEVEQKDKQDEKERDEYLKVFSRLTGAYKEQYYWYELVMVAYRLFMVCVLPLIASGKRGQRALGMCVELIMMLLLVTLRPYKESGGEAAELQEGDFTHETCDGKLTVRIEPGNEELNKGLRKTIGNDENARLALSVHASVFLWMLATIMLENSREQHEANDKAIFTVVFLFLLFGSALLAFYLEWHTVSKSLRESKKASEDRAEAEKKEGGKEGSKEKTEVAAAVQIKMLEAALST